MADMKIRPLRRVDIGVWRSRDRRWAFHRHESDPHPRRWYAYLDDCDDPQNDGMGHVTLRQVADWAERFGADAAKEAERCS